MPMGKYKRTKERAARQLASFRKTMAAKKAAGWKRGEPGTKGPRQPMDTPEGNGQSFPLALIPDRPKRPTAKARPMPGVPKMAIPPIEVRIAGYVLTIRREP